MTNWSQVDPYVPDVPLKLYTLENEQTIAEEARFMPLSLEQIDEQLKKFDDATTWMVDRQFLIAGNYRLTI